MVSWSYKFNCLTGSDDDHFLDGMQKHYAANKRVRISYDLPTGPPGAGEDGGEDGDEEGLWNTGTDEEHEVPEEGVPHVREH